MTITVEDGTGLAAAVSYISVADADAYFTAHDDPTAWSGLTTALKESALRYATTSLDGLYSWVGVVATSTQNLGWPRTGVWDEEGRKISGSIVPTRIEVAVCELALLHRTEALNSNYSRGNSIRSERVGPIETVFESGAQPDSAIPILRRIIMGLGKARYGITGDLERA